MKIDIRNEIYALREAQTAILEKVEDQLVQIAGDTLQRYDAENEGDRDTAGVEFTMAVLAEASSRCTTYQTDSMEGFIEEQVRRKLIKAASEPGGYMIRARFGV